MENLIHTELIQPRDLPGVFTCFLGSWMVLGIPTLIVLLGLSFFVRFPRSFWLSWPVIGLCFGLATGFYDAWDDHQYWAARAQDHWYDVFAIPGAPGDLMANSYGGDWQADEAWDYRGDITVLNGLFWMSVGIAGMWAVRLFTGRIDYSDAPTPEKLLQPTTAAL